MPKVPACPACGAKFSHDSESLSCKVCGIPDEIVDLGPQMIARYKRKVVPGSKSKRKHLLKFAAHAGTRHKKKKPHGRS